MTPEIDSNIKKTIQDLLLTALINEVMKHPEVQAMLESTAKAFVPVMMAVPAGPDHVADCAGHQWVHAAVWLLLHHRRRRLWCPA